MPANKSTVRSGKLPGHDLFQSDSSASSQPRTRGPSACSLAPGQILVGRFRIDALLGEGGMGQVYIAEDLLVRNPVALKVIHPELAAAPGTRTVLLGELRMARRVTHSNVCRLYDAEACDEGNGPILFLTMELLRGETLAERLAREPRLKLEESAGLALQLCDAIGALHSAKVIHGDLKPSNVMLTEEAGRLHATLMDFGLARALDAEAIAGPGGVFGTPAYMPPERAAGGPPNSEGDIYSLGVVLAQMLTELDVSTALDGPATERRLSLPAHATLRHLGRKWLDLVNRCLETDPARRFPSAAAVRAALTAEPRRLVTWKSVSAAAGLLLLAAGLGLMALLWTPTNDVAVIAFANFTGDPSLDYAAEGLSQSLQQNLARFPRVLVAPWSFTRKWRGPTADPAAVGRDLHTRAFVGGVLNRRGSDLTLEVEVVDTSNRQPLWSRRYTRPATNLLDMEESLLADIGPQLFHQSGPARAPGRVPNRAAYDLYLRGLSKMNRRTPEDLTAAAELFRDSSERDPEFALAHAGLSNALYMFRGNFMQPAANTLPQAEAQARRALELDPDLPEAHLAMGQALAANFQWAAAEAEFRRAIRLNPQYAEAHGMLARLGLLPVKRYEEAILEAKRGVDLDPENPFQRWSLAYVLYEARHFRILVNQLEHYEVSSLPDTSMVRLTIGAIKGGALAGLGRTAEAIAATDEAASPAASVWAAPPYFYITRSVRGYALALAGRRQEAEAIGKELSEIGGAGVHPCYTATIYAALGNRDRAIELIETCYAVGAPGIPFIGVDVRYDSLRSDPRFQAVLAKANLP